MDVAIVVTVVLLLNGNSLRRILATLRRQSRASGGANRGAHADEKPRRRFQFSLRTLLIGVTLLGVACGYIARQAEMVHDRRAVLADIESNGGGFFSTVRTTAGFWNRFPNWPDQAIASIGSKDQHDSPAGTMMRTILGDEVVVVIWLPTTVPRSEQDRIRKFIPEAYLWKF
ncbi:MAG TPA: hypothetical protein VGY55_04060 [Pirellulales bacterium]|nr:hypothetical protein [Pirellulales bacterium]